MVVKREKYLVAGLLLQTQRSLVALQTLNPTTAKATDARLEAMACLREARTHLRTLSRHYHSRGHKEPSPQGVHSDLP